MEHEDKFKNLRNSIVDFKYISAEEALSRIILLCGEEEVINYFWTYYGQKFLPFSFETFLDENQQHKRTILL